MIRSKYNVSLMLLIKKNRSGKEFNGSYGEKRAHFLDVSNIQIYTDVLNAAVVSINNVMTLNWQYTSGLAFVSSVLGNGDLLIRSTT